MTSLVETTQLELRWTSFLNRLTILYLLMLPLPVTAIECLRPLPGQPEVGSVHYISPPNTDDSSSYIFAKEGIYLFKDGKLLSVATSSEIGTLTAYSLLNSSEKRYLVGTYNGLFYLHSFSVKPIFASEQDSRVVQIYSAPSPYDLHFIFSTQGLFRWKNGELHALEFSDDTDWVHDVIILDAENEVIIASASKRSIFVDSRLYRLRGNTFYPIETTLQSPSIQATAPPNLIGTFDGIFRLEGTHFSQLHKDANVGWVRTIVPENHSGQSHLIGAANGLFRLANGRLDQLDNEPDSEFYHVITILRQTAVSNDYLIGTESGAFQLQNSTLLPIAPNTETGAVLDFIPLDQARERYLFVARKGLYLFDGRKLLAMAADETLGWVSEISILDAVEQQFIVTAEKGLFYSDGTEIRRILLEPDYFFIGAKAQKTAQGTILVGSNDGLYEFASRPLASSQVEQSLETLAVFANSSTRVDWSITHPCSHMISHSHLRLVDQDDNVLVKNQSLLEYHHNPDSWSIRVRADIQYSERGIYEVQLELLDHDGWVKIGKPIQARVDPTPEDWIRFYAVAIAYWSMLTHTLLFVGLVIGSRWFTGCRRVLLDPVWGRVGLWFNFALRHFPPLQRWMLEPWFQRQRAAPEAQPYLELPLTDQKGNQASSLQLLALLRQYKKIWLQGNVGMGKSLLVEQLSSRFFRSEDLPTLHKAYQRYGYVPVTIHLREFRAIEPNSQDPNLWLVEIARAAFTSQGFSIQDQSLFAQMLTSGDFAVILDGANEIEHAAELELCSKQAAIKILITSQGLPQYAQDNFMVWHLPKSIRESLEPLLALYLGREIGVEVFKRIENTPLLDHIKSGYDVRLLADLAEENLSTETFPTTRLGLYGAILNRVKGPDGGAYPADQLRLTAWTMWRDGERTFQEDEHLPAELLEPLLYKGTRILRCLDGRHYEFRHDQMRGYLAAQWVAVEVVSPISLLESEERIWRHSRSEQEVVWDFLAEMVSNETRRALWHWATMEPDRAVLQHSLQKQSEVITAVKLIDPAHPL